VDLTLDRDDLLMTFASDARSNVRSGEDFDYEVREGDSEDAAWIIEQVEQRYAEQDKSYGLPPEMVAELHERLPDGAVRPYVVSLDGEPKGGMVALDDGDTIYRWQGGAKTDADAPVNDLLDWHIMCDAMDRGVEQYDLVGAENQRINRYKSKFNPELSAYYTLERSSKPFQFAAGLYDQLSNLK
jgi:lipid II:glycine glycyltransferase (peptidoglycan interpeptide bridge formation enzyme)